MIQKEAVTAIGFASVAKMELAISAVPQGLPSSRGVPGVCTIPAPVPSTLAGGPLFYWEVAKAESLSHNSSTARTATAAVVSDKLLVELQAKLQKMLQ